MTKRRLRRKMCEGKRAYDPRDDGQVTQARMHAASLSYRTGVPFHKYQCPFCGRLHVGRVPWKQIAGRTRRLEAVA